MSVLEGQSQEVRDEESGGITVPVYELVAALWARRRWLTIVTVTGGLIALGIGFITSNEYQSTAELMPPDQRSLTNLSVMDPLSSLSGMAGGGLLSARSPGQTIIGILGSQTIEDGLIDRFDLMHVYHLKHRADARTELLKRTVLDEDKKSGIVTIAVNDVDPYRARGIVATYIQELNELLIAEDSSSAHLERVFLEKRLASLKDELDATTSKLSQFSSRNATLNPQSQGTALVEAATRLQAELITAEGELSGLKAQYSDDNVRVRSVRARIEELQNELHKMGGESDATNSDRVNPDQPYPTLRQLPLLGATYTDLYRQMMLQESIYEALDKQYELAKVEEAKEIPTIRVIDPPQVPEKKFSPHRSIYLAVGMFVSAFFGIVWVIVRKLWELASDDEPIKAFLISIRKLIRPSKAV